MRISGHNLNDLASQTSDQSASQSVAGKLGLVSCLLAACLVLVGCGESSDAIKIRERLKERQAMPAESSQRSNPKPVQEWSGQRNSMLSPSVYGLGRLSPSSAYVIDTGVGLILIDTGVQELAIGLKNGLVEVGLKIEDVKYVLLTHAHYDHVFGANRVREVSGATVCIGAEDEAVLSDADEFALFSLFPRTVFSGTPIVVDRTLQDGDTIELGDTIVHALASPGHTPGSMCYLTQIDGLEIMFSGDVIASFRFGPATYPISISPKYRGDAESYLKTINRLLSRDAPDLLLPGHPRQHTFKRSMTMDSQQWRELLLPAKQEITTVVQRHQTDGRDFLDGIPKQIEEGVFYFGDIDHVAVYGVIAADNFTLINAPGGKQFVDWLQRQFKTLTLEFRMPDAVLLTTLEEKGSSGLIGIDVATPVMAPGEGESMRVGGRLMSTLKRASLSQLIPTSVDVISIGDPAPFALAYVLTVNEKRVLITSSAPRNVGLDWVSRKSGVAKQSLLQPQATDLLSLLQSSDVEREQYSVALDAVADLRPDIWLPSLPLTGQNANLYDDAWDRIIEANRDLAQRGSD